MAKGGSIGFEFSCGGEGESKGGVKVLLYEAKNKRQKLRCLLLPSQKKIFFYLYDVITWEK